MIKAYKNRLVQIFTHYDILILGLCQISDHRINRIQKYFKGEFFGPIDSFIRNFTLSNSNKWPVLISQKLI